MPSWEATSKADLDRWNDSATGWFWEVLAPITSGWCEDGAEDQASLMPMSANVAMSFMTAAAATTIG